MITGVVLARNEERNVITCLEHLRPHVDEVILIDMQSDDRTVELARPWVDQILSHEVIPNFDAARNIAIPAACHDWMWFVDADERISEATGQLVNRLVRERGDELTAITIPFKSYFCGQWMQHCGWWPGYTMPRILKRGTFSFAAQLHGGVHHQGPAVRVAPDPEVAVDHFSYESIEHYLEKLNRYTSTEAAQMASGGAVHDWREAMRHMVHELFNYYERNPGSLDGIRGWLLSWLSGQYRWLSHAKLIDIADRRDGESDLFGAPANLDEAFDAMADALAEARASTPQLPLGIVWRGPLWDPSGYADESRSFIKALAAGDREFAVEDVHWADATCDLPVGDKILLKALSNTRRPKYSATITNCICTLAAPVAGTSLNILRTTFETDRLPDGWLDYLLAYDEIWVISQHNYRAFVRSGVPPERLRVVPSCFDETFYHPEGEKSTLPEAMRGRFIFLSVFDWDLRKGWDLLLRAYVQAFRQDEGVGLLLKITRNHGHTLEEVQLQIDDVLQGAGWTLADRPDIHLWDSVLANSEVAALYRSVNAFVLPTRGEGWGRPYMEAMASGLPCIGTNASGNVDFMNDGNSFLIPASEVEVPEQTAHGMQTYAGHRWYEPDLHALQSTMRAVFDDRLEAKRRGAIASAEVRERFGLAAGRRAMEEALQAAELRFSAALSPSVDSNQIGVELEGELLARHSFAHVNEQLVRRLGTEESIALSVQRRTGAPAFDDDSIEARQVLAYVGRPLDQPPAVIIRHQFPPNWGRPEHGKWVHIQPWEYGHLPVDWVEPLKNDVDEIWVPSQYVEQVYRHSGVDPAKIQLIPWGIEPDVHRPDAIPLLLPCRATFRFLFLGGAIGRKGFDRALDAYIAEFQPSDDVCLVIKDMGADSFYPDDQTRERIRTLADDPTVPEILYLNQHLTQRQMPSLLTACHCLVAPYRGEGFGLPILEAMACGLPPIIPRGGPSDDFASEESAFLLSSVVAKTPHAWKLCASATQLNVSIADLRAAMRGAFEDQQRTRSMGLAGSEHVREKYTWERTVAKMVERIRILSADTGPKTNRDVELAAVLLLGNSAREAAIQLAQIRPFVDELTVAATSDDARIAAVTSEYGARLRSASGPPTELWRELATQARAPWIWIPDFGERWTGNPNEFTRLRQQLENVDDGVGAVTAVMNREGMTSRIPGCFVRNRGEVLNRIEASPSASLAWAALESSIVELVIDASVVESPVSTAQVLPDQHLPVEQWLEPWAPKRGRVFLDIGANVGAWTRWLAGSYDRVHAFEPHPDAVRQLQRGLPSNVTVHPKGAWSHSAVVEFSQFENSVHLSAYFQEEGIHTGPRIGRTEIECVAIDDLQIEGPIDFIKCDTEGAEREVLAGAKQTILANRPWLLIEIHSVDNFTAVTTLLGEWNYLFSVIRDPYYEPFSELWYAHCWLSCQAKST